MGCFEGFGSQEALEAHYRQYFARTVRMYCAFSPDRSEHFTLLLDSGDNTVGLVHPGKDEVEEWFTQDEADQLFEYRGLEGVLSRVPKDYTFEDARGSIVTRESLSAANMLPKL